MDIINLLPYGILLFALVVSCFRKNCKIRKTLLAMLFLVFGVFCVAMGGWWGFAYFVLLAGVIQDSGAGTYALLVIFCFLNMLLQWIWSICDAEAPVILQSLLSAYGGLLIFVNADEA